MSDTSLLQVYKSTRILSFAAGATGLVFVFATHIKEDPVQECHRMATTAVNTWNASASQTIDCHNVATVRDLDLWLSVALLVYAIIPTLILMYLNSKENAA